MNINDADMPAIEAISEIVMFYNVGQRTANGSYKGMNLFTSIPSMQDIESTYLSVIDIDIMNQQD